MKTIIMAGGYGKRLWPLSRKQCPKQLAVLPLPHLEATGKPVQQATLIEQTIARLSPIVARSDLFLSLQAAHVAITENHIGTLIPREQFILEPTGKDTAAAILLALLQLLETNPSLIEEVLFFTPADHYIEGLNSYHTALQLAAQTAAASNKLTVIGINPAFAATDYGYLETSQPAKELLAAFPSALQAPDANILSVSRFHEKPQQAQAQTYLKQGNFLWNSGMFFAKSAVLLKYFEELLPTETAQMRQYLKLCRTGKKTAAAQLFAEIKPSSFDYAIAENLKDIFCIPASFRWDDLGSLGALERLNNIQPNENQNTLLGRTEAFASSETFVHNANSTQQTIVLNGVTQLNVIAVADVIYISDKRHAIPFKELIAKLAQTDAATLL